MSENKTYIATCPYCGQTTAVELPEKVPEPDADALFEAAIENCKCWDAENARKTKKRLEDAKYTIMLMYPADEDEELRDLIYNAVKLIVTGKIVSVQVNAGYGRAIKIRDKRDKVQIMEIRREADAEEV